MTLRLAFLFASTLLAACGPTAPPPSTPVSSTDAQSPPAGDPDSIPCAQEIARVCPAGQKDACLFTPHAATTHMCVMDPQPPPGAEPGPDNQHTDPQAASPGPTAPHSRRIDCKARIRQICPDGFVDGCSLGVTQVHSCVRAGSTAGPSCATGVLAKCPADTRSACEFDPPIAPNDVCVLPDNRS